MDKDKRERDSGKESLAIIDISDDSVEQVQSLTKEERAKIERDIFQRKPTVARTPPPGKDLPIQREDEDDNNLQTEKAELQGENVKRKRGEESPMTSVLEKEPKKLREVGEDASMRTKLIESVMDLISRVDASVANLYSITSSSRNTKVEIRDEAEKLVLLMKKLANKDIGHLIEEGGITAPKTREVGVQVEVGRKPAHTQKEEETAEVTSLSGSDTQEGWRGIANRRWHPDVFTRTRVIYGGDMMDTRDGVIKVAFAPKDGDRETSKKVWERFPELLELKDEFAVLEQTTKIRAGSEVGVTRKVIKVTRDDNDEELWTSLCRVGEKTKEDEVVAFQQPTGRSTTYFRKMLECIFQNMSTKILIYANNNEQLVKKKQRRKPKENKNRDTFALVVEGTRNETYTNVLRQVKDKVRESTASRKIRGLRSTRDGRLLITMDRDEAATTRVQEILSEMRGELKVTKAGQKAQETTIHIRGMDALTTKQDVIEAVERRVGPLTGKICRISDLRPNLGNTLAVTLVLNKEEAETIVEEGTLRVGCVRCNVERRITLMRCYRCWSYTHKASECSSDLDRSKCCYRCGEEDHTAKSCNKEEACPVCGEHGHMADTRNCRIFRLALQRAREEARKNIRDGREIRRNATRNEDQEIQEGCTTEKESETGEPDELVDSEGRQEIERPEEGPGLGSHSNTAQTS